MRIMNTLTSGKEDRIAFPKSRQILLTCKKLPGNCRNTAVIKSINKIKGPKIVGSQLVVIKSNSRDGRSLGSEENDHSDVDFEVDGTQMLKMRRTPIENGKSLDKKEQHFMLKNLDVFQSNYCQSCNKVLYRCERCDESDTKSLGSPTLNRHDRFVPNILRNTKAVENMINNNYDPTNFEVSQKTEERNRKRKRKQVLVRANNGFDCAPTNYCQNNDNNFNRSLPSICNHNSAEGSETETLPATTSNSETKDEEKSVERPRRKYRRRKKKKVNQSSPHVPNETETLAVTEKNETETLPVTTSNLEDKDAEESVDMEAEGSAAAEEAAKDDLYSAELNIRCENVEPPSPVKMELDVSIKKIFDEYEVADYGNYVASDGLNFYTDEMDKLLSSDVEGSSVGCDADDNNVDDCGKGLETLENNNERKSVDIGSNIEYCNQETEPAIKIRRAQRYSELDDTCFRSFKRDNVYQPPKMALASCMYKDYYSSYDFQEFDQTPEGLLSSTDSASEFEDEQTSFVPSPSLPLPKTDDVDLSTLMTVSDVVPDNVFGDESGSEADNGGLDSGADVTKRQLDSGPITQKDDANLTFSIGDDHDCFKPVEGLNDLELFNGLRDILNFDFTASSSPDESCKDILADSNIDFDDERFLPGLDIENTDDIEISKLLEPDTDSSLQPAIIKPLAELVNAKPDQSAEEKPEKIIETGCNIESEVSNVVDDENTPLEDYREIEWNDEGDFESERDELVSSHNPETKDTDKSEPKSGVRRSTRLLGESGNTKKSKMSRLESLLTRPKPLVGNRPEVSWAHSEFGCSRVNCISRYPKVDVPNSAVLSKENPSRRETEHQNTGYTDDTEDTRSQVTEEAYMDAQEAETDSDRINFRTHTKIMIYRPMEFEPSHDQSSHDRQLDLGRASLRKASTSGSPLFDSRNPKLDVRKKLVKRKQYAKQNPKAYYPCSFCEQTCRSRISLTNHIQARHRSVFSKKYVCNKCSKEYSSAGSIQNHLIMHENYTITCKVCGKHFAEKVHLKRHHNNSQLCWGFECRCCGAKHATTNMLNKHAKQCR